MKKLLVTTTVILMTVASFAQSLNLKKAPSVGFGFFLKDLNASTSTNIDDMAKGLHLSYFQGISNHLDFMALLGTSFTKYVNKDKVYSATQEHSLIDLNTHVNLKMFTDKTIFNPYLTAGASGSLYNTSYLMAHVGYGAGIQVSTGDGSFLYVQSIYKTAITTKTNDEFNYYIGFATPIKAKPVVAKKPAPIAPVVEVDTDGDGIVDSKDKCPTVKGLAKYEGCPIPDTDGDGINDEEDKCPAVAGIAKYHGCPIPDTDGDGINDEEDKCPTVMGLARYQGCPIPDTDGDGINDEDDKCPTVAGVKENGGCPAIQEKLTELAKNIYFNTGTATISTKATKSLDDVAEILKKYPASKLTIEGHTDNTGKEELNKKLSQSRADAIKAYFEKKGIETSRLIANGYGSEKPVADNKTEAGKAQNRRVELKATY